jgi:hypothetical protein
MEAWVKQQNKIVKTEYIRIEFLKYWKSVCPLLFKPDIGIDSNVGIRSNPITE